MNHFKSLAEVRAAQKAADLHFFDRETMAFFQSKTHGDLVGGRYFITSEIWATFPRRYRIRLVGADAEIGGVGGPESFSTLAEARAYLKKQVRGGRT